MPQIIVTTTEISSSSGVPTDTGTVFVAGVTDQGPPPAGPPYVLCQSLAQYISVFGPRTPTSALLYDFLDELFHDGGAGAVAYVTTVTDATASIAGLTLTDGQTPGMPTVSVQAQTPGLAGNQTYVQVVAGTAATVTASTTNASSALTNISSTANIGVGTPVSGNGIPAGTYLTAVNTAARTATMSQPATATGAAVTVTPGTVTVEIQDSSGDLLEEHGPYSTTTQLFADSSSTLVTFSQSTAAGNTQNLPAALPATALTGGADASDLTDASHVAALGKFPKSLGPGTVCLPGRTSPTAWSGLDAHAIANNRWAAKDMADSTSSAAVIAAAKQAGYSPTTYGLFVQGSLMLPGVGSGPLRTCPGSAAVAALRARVSVTPNQNTAPCGLNWGLGYPLGFTTSYGPALSLSVPAGTFTEADVQSMEQAGVNCFANFFGTLCLFGFVTPVSKTVDPEFWQASSSVERMNLQAKGFAILARYLFADIDEATLSAMNTDFSGLGLTEFTAGALYGETANEAFAVLTGSPVNTDATAESGQLNALMRVRLTKYADTVTLGIGVVPDTQPVATIAA